MGQAASSRYTTTGSGANLLCLPPNPQYIPGQYSDAANPSGDIYRAEYFTSSSGIPYFQNLTGTEIPCAVCNRQNPLAKTLMVPGSFLCPNNFAPDYQGYLFAPPTTTSYRGQYVCVDAQAEGIGSNGLEGGHLLSPVEASNRFNMLQGYSQGFELSCVVCGSVNSGSVYTRWGRTTCPTSNSLVYAGRMAGQFFNYEGGGVNSLCMSPSPTYWPGTTAGIQAPSSQLFQTEYETLVARMGTAWNNAQDFEVPCAVCQSAPGQSYSFMQPGRAQCPTGFTTDYQGYLMTMAINYLRTSYSCVDANPEAVGDNQNLQGNQLYFAQTTSNAAAAPLGFSNNYEISCSHCTATSGGSVFVDWGDTSCPAGSNLIYAGQSAGAYFSWGGGHEYLCLPPTPGYLSYFPQFSAGALVFATEYETATGGVASLRGNSGGQVPCALCQRTGGRPASLMIPALTTCPLGFAVDYFGYLVSSLATNNALKGEYVCLTNNSQYIGNKASSYGSEMFEVEAQAPLPAGYFAHYELSCTVCSACSGDSYIASDGNCAPAAICTFGQYTSTMPTPNTNRVCSPCPAGTFQPLAQFTGSSCTPCSGGFQNETGASACRTCSPGFILSSPTVQQACPAGSACLNCQQSACAVGTYQPSVGTSACLGCPADRYQNEMGQLQCKVCPSGTFASNPTTLANCPVGSACLSCMRQPCAVGTFQASGSQSACSSCPLNTYQNEQGTTSCKSCSAGFYTTSAAAQTVCPLGSSCSNCVISACPTGLFQNQTGMSFCYGVRSCSAGTFSSRNPTPTSDRVCSACAAQSFTPTVNTLPSCFTATQCAAGSFVFTAATPTSNAVCNPCPANTFQDQVGQSACKPLVGCPLGTFTSSLPVNGPRVCSTCSLAFSFQDVPNFNGTSCKPVSPICSPGFAQTRPPTTSTNRACTACTQGSTFQDVAGQTACKTVATCAVGTFQSKPPTTSADRVCSSCDGTTNFQDQTGATSCKTMTTCVNGAQFISRPGTTTLDRQCTNCRTSCAGGFFLTGSCSGQSNPSCSSCSTTCRTCNGSLPTNCLSCVSNLVLSGGQCLQPSCNPGTFLPAAGPPCQNCASPCATCAGNSSNCLSCSTSTFLVGNACLSSCPANTFMQSVSGATRCVPCSNCSAGSFQLSPCQGPTDTGCRAWATCPVGQYQTIPPTATSDRNCSRCPVPTSFQNQAGQAFCLPTTACQPGAYVLLAPTTSTDRTCAPCLPGSGQAQINQNSCLSCPTGQYQSQWGQAGCLPCAADSFQPQQNQTSCILVPPGYYRSADGSNRVPCPAGSACPGGSSPPQACDGLTQFQNNTMATSCLIISLCGAGQYQTVAPSPTNNRVCSPCRVGSFNSQSPNTATSCTPFSVCGPGFLQSFNGSAISNTQCLACQLGLTFQDESGAFACKPVATCQPGTSIAVNTSTVSNRICQSCISGVNFQDQANQASCKPVTACTLGQYQSQPATVALNAVCLACPGNSFQNEAGLPSCKPLSTCQPGQFASIAPTVTSNRVCGPCPSNTFQPSAGTLTACTTATTCASGSFTSTPVTPTSNAVCTSCTLNSTFQSASGATSCISTTVCGAGQLVAAAATLIANRVCQGCPQGTFQDAQVTYSTVCKTVRPVCPAGYAENIAPTPTNDRSCLMCDGVNFYSDVPGLTLCKTATVCNSTTQYMTIQPTPFSDRVCAMCLTQTDCRANQVLQGNCTGGMTTTSCASCSPACATCNDTTATSCTSCINGLNLDATGACLSSCRPGQYSGPGRVCMACNSSCATCGGPGALNCTSCPAGRFLSGLACVATCPIGTFASMADGRCVPCSTCAFGGYATANCTATADTTCTTWSICAAGSFEVTAPTAVRNRGCASCNGVSQYQDQPGQYSCKFTTTCSFPNIQGLPPTSSSDRLCICDTPSCRDLVTQTYNTNMCAPPSNTQLGSGVSDCCAGTTTDVLTAILQSTTQFTARHTCAGCFDSNCSCTAGFFQSQTAAGSNCLACNGVTGFSPETGLTACSTIAVCTSGSMQTLAPTSSSNRVCAACAAGTSDLNRLGLACTPCPVGNYVPPGSAGPCSQYACPAGSAGTGIDASTPCTPCPSGAFQPLAGQTSCNATTVCAAGFEEFVMPSPVSNRFCRGCIPGFTYKAQAGQATTCSPVSHCGIGEEEMAAPTLTSDRLCSPCPTGTFKLTAGDFACTAVTQCGIGQEEVQLPSAVSDRVCRSCVLGVSYLASLNTTLCQSVTPCSGDQFQTIAPTVSSDRQCQSLTNCQITQFQVTAPTVTSDRACANCSVCPAGRFQIRECLSFQDAQCSGCDVCVTGKFQSRACTQTDNTECQNCSTCLPGFFQTAACSAYNDISCLPLTRCEPNQFIAVPASPVSNLLCRNFTICNLTSQYVFVAGTSQSDRICRDLTVCQPGSKVVTSPGENTDRVCQQCPAGTSDVDGTGLACVPCIAGTYVPVGSSGECSQFTCAPGMADLDGRSSTPCVSCNFTNSYQSLSGQTACLPVSQCGPGYQEVAAPTLFTNRVCQACLAGINFKTAAGSDSQCQFVTQCTAAQWMQAPPTISSDRQCVSYTTCNASQYETSAITPTSDRTCAALANCNSSQYQSTAPTATSNRACSSISTCSSLQYEAMPPTATSDRSCQQLAICILPAFEVAAPTATSNRICNQSYGANFYFNGDFDSMASTTEQQNAFMSAFNSTMVELGMPASALAGMTIQRGSILLQAFLRQQAMRGWLYTQMLSGNVTVLNTSAVLCPTGLYLQLPIDPSGVAVRCLPPTQCTVDYFQQTAMTATADAVCRLLTPCVNTAVPPTYTTDRVCAVLGEASTSNSSAGLSPIVLGIIVILIALVVALIVGMLLVHRKRVRDRKQQQTDYDQARIAETNRAFQDGNMMLSQLNKGNTMNFANPLFARSGGEGYLDVNPTPDWMAGNLSREQAEAALSSRVIGAFLVRASQASGCFVLSLKIGEGEYEHHRVQQVGNTFTLNGKALSVPCSTIYEVLDHLSSNPEGISCCLAHMAGNTYGVKKGEDDQVFYGAHEEEDPPMYGAHQPWLCKMTRKEATERLLRENPVRGHFVIRESESKPGNYAISLVISPREVEHHSLLRGVDGVFLLNDRAMTRRCADLPAVVDHLTSTKESMTCLLDQSFWGAVAIHSDDLYSGVRNAYPAGAAAAAPALSNPMYAEAAVGSSHYSPLSAVSLPGAVPGMPTYFDPAISPPADGYLSVEGSAPVIHSDADTHAYQNVSHDAVRRKRETLA